MSKKNLEWALCHDDSGVATSQNSGIVATIIMHFQLSWLYNAEATRRGVIMGIGP